MGQRLIVHESPGYRGEHPALFVAVIGCHSRMGPDHLLMFGIDLPDIFLMDVLADVDCSDTVFDHLDKACGDVAALAFGLEDHAAAMCRTRIGAEHAEEIREIRHREAKIGGWIVVGPDVPEVLAV